MEKVKKLENCNADYLKSTNGNSLKGRLIERLEDILLATLGEPMTNNDKEWRYGNNGSLSIDVGPKRGVWYDFETDEGGYILKLLARNWKLNPSSEQIKPGIEIKTCFVCGTKNNKNRVYCRHCQTPIKEIICPVCEHVNPYEQKYCTECDSILQNKRRY